MAISKREMLANVMRFSGILPVMERMPGKPFVVILNYHRIGDSFSSELDRAVFSATAEMFDFQLSYMKQHYHALSAPEIQNLHETLENLDKPSFIVTFDDGYCDNYDVAYPILSKHKIPGLFFIATSFIGQGKLPWWDSIAFIIRNANADTIRLSLQDGSVMQLNVGDTRFAIKKVLRHVKAVASVDCDAFIVELARKCGVDIAKAESQLSERLFMSENMIREMSENGMFFGSHTHTHRILSHLSPEEQRVELAVSREVLGDILGEKPGIVAYPVGDRKSWTEDTSRIASELGYKLGFSFCSGLVRKNHSDWFDVPREGMNKDYSFTYWRTRLQFLRHWNIRY